jgi:hypothetical protein
VASRADWLKIEIETGIQSAADYGVPSLIGNAVTGGAQRYLLHRRDRTYFTRPTV